MTTERRKPERTYNTGLLGFGLSQSVIDYYADRGIRELFDWQKQCLRFGHAFERQQNLVYSAPTSAGKSLVADIMMFQVLMRQKLKVIVVLPYVSIVQERVNSLKYLFRKIGLRMDAFAGSTNLRGGLDRTNVAVCTIEKANIMINKLIDEDKINQLGLVVVDELQMMGNASRGYLIELILSKINYIRKYLNRNIQVVGMSAAIANLTDIGDWIDGVTYVTKHRPVTLHQYVVCKNQVFVVKKQKPEHTKTELIVSRPIPELQLLGLDSEYASLVFLTCEALVDENSVLIFCPTKILCESVALKLATSIRSIMGGSTKNFLLKHYQEMFRSTYVRQKKSIESLVLTLKRSHAGLDNNLRYLIQFGIAFHHAGIVMEQRAALEQAFRDGLIRVLFSTTTLSAGVNLPAARVMIVTPYDHANKILEISDYLQMIGRSGRKGLHSVGESFLFCLPKELNAVRQMLASKPKPIGSSLVVFENAAPILESYERIQQKDKKSRFKDPKESITINNGVDIMFRTVLEVLSNGLVLTLQHLLNYIGCTFMASQSSPASFRENVLRVVHALIKNRLVEVEHEDFNIPLEEITPELTLSMADDTCMSVTAFGKAVISSHIKPTDSAFILTELRKCQKNCCLSNDLHLIYETTPMSIVCKSLNIDWNAYYTMYRGLSEEMRHAADLIGIKEYFLVEMISGMNTSANNEILTTHKRFYVSMALFELVQEVPMETIKNKYQISKGDLQSLQQQASSFAGMLTIFCNHMGWSTMELLIDNFQPRLSFAVQRELVDLVRLPNISASIARQLYSHGFDTVIKLINCKPIEIAQVLVGKKSPLVSNDDRIGQSNSSLFKIEVYLSSSDQYITIEEFSKKIIMDARMLVESDIGHPLNLEPISDEPLIPRPGKVRPRIGPFGLELEPPVLRPGPYRKPQITPEVFRRQQLKELVPPRRSRSTPPEGYGSAQQSDELSQPGPSRIRLRPYSSQPEQSGQGDGEFQNETPCEPDPSSSSAISGEKSETTCETNTQRSSTPIKADENEKSRDANLSMSVSFGDESLLEDVVRAQEQQQQQQQQQQQENNEQEPIPGPSNAFSSNGSLKRPLDTETEHSLDASTLEAMNKQSTSSSLSNDDADGFTSSGDDSDDLGPSKKKIQKLSIGKSFQKELISKPSTSSQNDSSLDTDDDSSTSSQSELWDESSFFNYENVQSLLDFTSKEKRQIVHRMPIKIRNEPNVDKASTIWIKANSVDECEAMFLNLFKKIGKPFRGQPIVHSVYFRLKPYPKNENNEEEPVDEEQDSDNRFRANRNHEHVSADHLIENSHYLPLNDSDLAVYGVYIKRYGCPKVYWVYGKAALTYLCEHWFQAVSSYVFRRNMNPKKADILGHRKLRIVAYDMKISLHCLHEAFNFDRKFLFEHVDWWDASTALWLLNPEAEQVDFDRISLSQLRQLMLKHSFDGTHSNQICESDSPTRSSRKRPRYLRKFGKVHRAVKALMLYNFVWLCLRALNEVNLLDSYFFVEIPARLCVFIMETNPICVDLSYLRKLENLLFRYLRNIEGQIFRDTGSHFDIGDPKQVAQALYSKCNLISNYFNVISSPNAPRQMIQNRKAPLKLTKHLGTSKESLQKLQEACGNRTRLPTMVIEWRKLDFAITNSIRSIRQHGLINEKNRREAIIYSKCNEWTRTGRIMMHEPNLICFPKDFPITTVQNCSASSSLANQEPVIVKVRKLLKSKTDYLLVAADYCQLELRILAHLSEDPNLMNALEDIDKDIFKSIAANWKNIPYEDVSNDDRQQAKQICYGIIYGMGNKSLAEKLSIPLAEATNLRMEFFERYPNVSKFIDESIEKCEKLGHIRTLLGRQRPVQILDNYTKVSEYNHACRQAVNSRIQGSAADLFKLAMIKMQKKIFKNEWEEISLCLQMHDELMFQVHKNDCDKFVVCLKKTMQKISHLINIPLPVKICVGPNWSELEEVVFAEKKESTPSHISETSGSDSDNCGDGDDDEDGDGEDDGSENGDENSGDDDGANGGHD